MLEVRGAKPTEVDAAVECAGRAFGRDDAERVRGITDFFSRIHKLDPYFRPDNSRIAVVDGVVASVVQIFDREMLVQGVPVPLGGIGSVGTDPHYTRRGLSNKVLTDSVEYMVQRGLVLSSLGTGIHDHYGKVGWQRFDHHAYLELTLPNTLPDPPTGVTIRQMDWDRDRAAVARVHAEFNRGVSGVIHRPTELWEATPKWRGVDMSDRHVAEVAGEIVAYRQVHARDGGDQIGEIGHLAGHAEAAHALILDVLSASSRRGAERSRIDNLAFRSWLASVGIPTTVGRHGGWMYRINDLPRLLGLLAPSMTERLVASDAAGWTGVVSLESELGGVALAVRDGAVEIAAEGADTDADARLALTHKQTIELVFGQVAPSSFVDGEPPNEEAAAALDILFPATEYRWYGWDGF